MHVSFFPRQYPKEVMKTQQLYKPGMSYSEEMWHLLIRKSIKYRGHCRRSNKINGDFGQIAKEQNMCRSYRPLQHVVEIGLNLTYF